MNIQPTQEIPPTWVQGYLVEETVEELQRDVALLRQDFKSTIQSIPPISSERLISSCEAIFNKSKQLLEKHQNEVDAYLHNNSPTHMQTIVAEADSEYELTKIVMGQAFLFFDKPEFRHFQDRVEQLNAILDIKITEILISMARANAPTFKSDVSKYAKQLKDKYNTICSLEILDKPSHETESNSEERSPVSDDVDSTCAVAESLRKQSNSISEIASKISHIKKNIFQIIDCQNLRQSLIQELQLLPFHILEPLNDLTDQLKTDCRALDNHIGDREFILNKLDSLTFGEELCKTARKILNSSLKIERDSLLEEEINVAKIEQAELTSQFVMKNVEPQLRRALEALENLQKSIPTENSELNKKITHQKIKITAYLALLQGKKAQISHVNARVNTLEISDESLPHLTDLPKDTIFEDISRECDIDIDIPHLRSNKIFEELSLKFEARIADLLQDARNILAEETMDNMTHLHSQVLECLIATSHLKDPIICFLKKCSRLSSKVKDLGSLQEEQVQARSY
jgi:hypothetical protein